MQKMTKLKRFFVILLSVVMFTSPSDGQYIARTGGVRLQTRSVRQLEIQSLYIKYQGFFCASVRSLEFDRLFCYHKGNQET